MNSQASRIILDVERACGDLRRGVPVILREEGKPALAVLSGEHHPGEKHLKDAASPAVQLMKLAGLLPLAVVRPVSEGEAKDLLAVTASAVAGYPAALAASLEKVSEANVPLPEAEGARFIAFRPRMGHEEHLAIVVGDLASRKAPLVRLHSSCVTGDIFGSLRCDCGTQLHKALRMIAEEGAGAVLYLSQEGRGIGIANKLRAYGLQDKGLDTLDANIALGFEADERDFAIAATMLRMLGAETVTLLTNNPMKSEELERHGITVAQQRGVITEPTKQNRNYLNTKADRMGHVLSTSCCGGN